MSMASLLVGMALLPAVSSLFEWVWTSGISERHHSHHDTYRVSNTLTHSLVIAMLLPRDSVLVLAFAIRLTSDLLGYGPVGGLAFLLTLAAFAAQRLHAVFGHDTVGAPLAILIALSLVVDILYAAFLLALSASLSPLDAFVYRALPCALYDAVLGLILYPLASRFIQGVQPTMKPVGPSQFR